MCFDTQSFFTLLPENPAEVNLTESVCGMPETPSPPLLSSLPFSSLSCWSRLLAPIRYSSPRFLQAFLPFFLSLSPLPFTFPPF